MIASGEWHAYAMLSEQALQRSPVITCTRIQRFRNASTRTYASYYASTRTCL